MNFNAFVLCIPVESWERSENAPFSSIVVLFYPATSQLQTVFWEPHYPLSPACLFSYGIKYAVYSLCYYLINIINITISKTTYCPFKLNNEGLSLVYNLVLWRVRNIAKQFIKFKANFIKLRKFTQHQEKQELQGLNIKLLGTQAEITCFASKDHSRSPWYPPSLQHVGDANIPGPDIKLPFLQAKHTTQDRTRVDPDPHVHVEVQLLPHVPGVGE